MNPAVGPGARRRGLTRLALVAILLLTMVVLALLSTHEYFEVEEVDLPDVVGLDLANAMRTLRLARFEVSTYPESMVGAGPNEVTSQSPLPGTVTRHGKRISLGVNTPPEVAPTPQLVGLSEAEATQIAATLNLSLIEVGYAYSDQLVDRIITQEPEAGAAIEGVQGLTLVVSRGPEPPLASVPDLIGNELEEAFNRLRELGFRQIDAVPSSLSSDHPGVVTQQLPEPGVAVPVSTPITLSYTLSSHLVVPIPDLKGASLQRAQSLLRMAGLKLGRVSFIQTDESPTGVTAFEPVGYTLSGSPVTLVVNSSEAGALLLTPTDTTMRQPETTASPSPSRTNGRVVPFTFDPHQVGITREFNLRLVIVDNGGERTVLDRRVEPGQTVSTAITIFGDAQLQTFIDNQLYQAWSP